MNKEFENFMELLISPVLANQQLGCLLIRKNKELYKQFKATYCVNLTYFKIFIMGRFDATAQLKDLQISFEDYLRRYFVLQKSDYNKRMTQGLRYFILNVKRKPTSKEFDRLQCSDVWRRFIIENWYILRTRTMESKSISWAKFVIDIAGITHPEMKWQ